MHGSLISQEQYAELYAKTDMRKVREMVKKGGVQAWRRFVEANISKLAKDASGQAFGTGLGLNYIDLRAPSYLLDPVYTPILNSTPRWGKVNAGYGLQPQWKAITSFDSSAATQLAPFVSEGNTNQYATMNEKNYSAPYITLGTDDYVTMEGISASEGYEDLMGDAKLIQLLRFRRNQERTYLGGVSSTGGSGTGLQIATTNTPASALNAAAATNLTNLPTGSYAAAYAVALNYRALTSPANTVSAGVTTQYLRSNADGSSDIINGGTGIVSAASAVAGPTTSPKPSVLFTVTPQAGAWGYAWFVQVNTTTTFTPAAASAKLTGITSFPYFLYTGQTQGTQTAAYSGTGGYAGFATDCSTNALDMDGILTIAANSNYVTNLLTPNFNNASWAGNVTVMGNVIDLHGAGLTNGGMVGSVAEFDNILQIMQSTTLTCPTRIYLSPDMVNCFTKAFMVGSTTGSTINFFKEMGSGDGVEVENMITKYFNRFALGAGAWIPVIQHPYLPAGTVLFDVDVLQEAYGHSRIGETRGVFVRRDTYGIEFAQTSRKYPFGVFSEEVLAVKTPNILAVLKGVGSFGTTALF